MQIMQLIKGEYPEHIMRFKKLTVTKQTIQLNTEQQYVHAIFETNSWVTSYRFEFLML